MFVLVLAACEKDENRIVDESNKMLGVWSNQIVNDSTVVYERVETFPENNYGIAFKPQHVFRERKNSEWCGTPPISYADYEGNWTKDGSIVNVTSGYWGGTVEYLWEIVSVDDEYLTIRLLKEEYHLKE